MSHKELCCMGFVSHHHLSPSPFFWMDHSFLFNSRGLKCISLQLSIKGNECRQICNLCHSTVAKKHIFQNMYKNCMAGFKTLISSLIILFPPLILPHSLITIWHSFPTLAPSLPLCHPSSWRQPFSRSHPSVSIHQDRIRFSALVTPSHVGLHNVIKQEWEEMISELQLAPSSIIYCSFASFAPTERRQHSLKVPCTV